MARVRTQHAMRTAARVGGLACAVSLALVLGACGEAGEKLSEKADQAAVPAGLGERRPAAVPAPERSMASRAGCAGAAARVGSPAVAYAALVEREAVVRAAPRDRAPVVSRLQRLGKRGQREVLGVIGVRSGARCAPSWYRVQLSVIPNGTTGWVRAREVHTFRVASRIVVDLSQRRLRLYRSGTLALTARVAIGASATPTPLGRYFVNERYVLSDASGPFGSHVLGISAHSEVLQDSWVENGPIAIHGTNASWLLGRAASHGCIRVANDVLGRMFPLVPAGTPIVVRA